MNTRLAVAARFLSSRSVASDQKLRVRFDYLLKKRFHVDINELGLTTLSHGEEIAQKRIEPADLTEDCS